MASILLVILGSVFSGISQLAYSGEHLKCTVSIPAPLFQGRPQELAAYKAVLTSHELKEAGETKAGEIFSVYRGGCLDYSEIFVFQFEIKNKALQDTPYWLERSSNVLKELGRISKDEHMRERGDELFRAIKTVGKKSASHFNFVLGKDQADLTFASIKGAAPKGDQVKVQLTIGEGI